MVVAFLLDPNAPITRQETVGDHKKIPPATMVRISEAEEIAPTLEPPRTNWWVIRTADSHL